MYTNAFQEAVQQLEEEKKERKLQKVYSLLEFIFLCVFGFTVGIGFTFGGLWFKDSGQERLASLLDTQSVKGVSTTTISPTLVSQEKTSAQDNSEPVLSCPIGFNFFQNDLFSFCYPNSLNQIYQDEESYLGKGLKITFVSSNEELAAAYNLEQSWNIHICNLEQKVKIDTYDAVRIILQEDKVSGCGDAKAYALMIKELDNKPFYIKLSKFDGTFADDKEFKLIEKSLRIK